MSWPLDQSFWLDRGPARPPRGALGLAFTAKPLTGKIATIPMPQKLQEFSKCVVCHPAARRTVGGGSDQKRTWAQATAVASGRSDYPGAIFPTAFCLALAFLGLCAPGVIAAGTLAGNLVVSIDRTTGDWADLAMGAPSAGDDADQSQNPQAGFTYVAAYGKPHAEAGARGLFLPRLNDGKAPGSGDDPARNIWFDTKGNSRILLDLGESMDLARVNVYSWHAGALSPQQYTLWAADRGPAPDAEPADLSRDWNGIASVNTASLGEGGKHGSSINAKSGFIGHYRYLLFDLPANKPEWSRSGFISEIDVYRAGRTLSEVKIAKREAGSQTLEFGEIHRTQPLQDETPFLLTGPKLYEYGAMGGTFPAAGRLEGDQGGVWCHPIKLLNKFEFEILEEGQRPLRLQGSPQFVHGFAWCKFKFNRNGLKITRQDFVSEAEPALFSLLTVRNETGQPRKLDVQFSGSVNIRPSYESRLPDGPDVVSYRDGLVSAFDSAMSNQWGVVFGSDQSPASHRVNGSNGILTYSASLPAQGETTLNFLILGEHEAGIDTARGRFRSVAGRATESLARKEALYHDRILGGVRFDCPDQAMNDAFYSAKANVLLSVMDLRPYYPAPFLAAGFPIYTWLFGCDSCYSTAGVVAGGFNEAARGTLECLLHYAGQKKQGAHEVASNGRLLGWDHIQETPQLVLACWKYFQWTGEMDFLRKAYPICAESVAHALATADRDRDGYLEGPGLMEQAGMGPERIDSVCYLYAACQSLAPMAEALKESGAGDYRRRAGELKQNFNRDWWNSEQKMWACSLRDGHQQTMDNFWAVCFPQEVGIADLDKASMALERIQNEWVNEKWGFVSQWKTNIAGEGVGVVHNNILALAAFTYGKADLGWKLMKLSAQAPLEERMLGAFDETMPGGGDLLQLWSFGPFLEALIGGLAGIHPQPDNVDLFPQLPPGLDWFKLEDCRIAEHVLTLEQRQTGQTTTTTITHAKGGAALGGIFWLPAASCAGVTMNGKAVEPILMPMAPAGITRPGLKYAVPPGQKLIIVVEK